MDRPENVPSDATYDVYTDNFVDKEGYRYDARTGQPIAPKTMTAPKDETTDKDLIKKYDQVYSEGEEKFFNLSSMEQYLLILKKLDFKGKQVLEIGCGTGDMASMMKTAGAKSVDAYDVSGHAIPEAINKYNIDDLLFIHGDPLSYDLEKAWRKKYDIIVMVGVLEHTENPAKVLDTILERFMGPDSILAVSCPLHLNPRGIVWLTCQYLFGVPMSLTDKHELFPRFFQNWAAERMAGLSDVHVVDEYYGTGPGMIEDLADRLPKALSDWNNDRHTSIPKDGIGKLLKFLAENKIPGHGANACYFITKHAPK
jgi:2-polyprenyl-3-methyl-5-hydroxy-6-metoxy-1,4-benzoquinol methylase